LAALRAAAIPVAIVPVHELFFHHASAGPAERRERPRYPISIVQVNADSVHRFLHFHGRSLARSRYRIGLWVWELPALRDEFWRELRHFDEIWVPSRFCQRGVRALTEKPVTVVPHVVAASDDASPGWREKLSITPDEIVFLYMFDATSGVERKNPQCLVDAFDTAFANNDRVRLVLKVANADKVSGLGAYLDEIGRRSPRVVVLRQLLAAEDVAGLVRACNCYVSPHRAEGFGLTVAEAMAAGRPVVSTDYSGTADFVTGEVGFPLRYRLVELDRDYGPYPRGAIWADPSRSHLVELLRGIAACPRAAAAKGERAYALMRERYSAAAVGRHIRERLAAIASV
jgi:glycosyltransferase involved in cell wall biosynthesis